MNIKSSLFQEISLENMKGIFKSALRENLIWETNLLDGGLFNTTYLVEYGLQHKKAVLRLGPVNRHLLMGVERKLMEAENYVYSECRNVGIPCSNVLAYDTSKTVIDRDFMIVEYIPSIVMAKAELTEEKRKELYIKMGEQLAKLHQVTGNHFGYVSRIYEGKYFETWSEALLFEVEDITTRLEQIDGLSGVETEKLRMIFRQSKELLDEIKVPHLLHTDLWEGNVLIDQNGQEIVAIIDGDRAVFGDIDFEFASSWMENPALKEGYGSIMKEPLSTNRLERRRLYQMFFYLLDAYVWYGEYHDQQVYAECKKKLLELLSCYEGAL